MKIKDKILIIALLGLLFAIFLNFIFHSFYWAGFPYEIVQDEGFHIERVSWIIKGEPLYPRPTSYPYIVIPYTPLFYIFCTPFFLLLGKKIIVGRIVSLIFTFLTAFYIYKIIAKTTAPPMVVPHKCRWKHGISLGGLAAVGLFFSSNIIFMWAPLSRVDMAANFFSILALYVISRGENSRNIILAALLSASAVFTKQYFLAPLMSVFLYLSISGRRKGLKFLFVSVFFMCVFFVTLQISSHGNFASQALRPPVGYYSFGRLKDFLFEYLRINYVTLLLSLFFLFFVNGGALYKLYFLCQVPILMTLGGSGSVSNHLIGILTASCILVGLLTQKAFEEPGYLSRNLIAVFLLYFLIFPNNTFYYFNFKKEEINPWTNRPVFDKIVKYMRESPGDVLSEYASFAFLAKKEVLIYPLTVSSAYHIPQTNLSQLLADCEKKRFSCIAYKSFMPLVIGDQLYNNYYLVETLKEKYSDWLGGSNTWYIMKPRIVPSTEIRERNFAYCSNLVPLSSHQDVGQYINDRTHGGNVISLGGKFYAKGIGVNSNSVINYNASGYKEFTAVIGLDDELDGLRPNYASIIFKAYLDDRIAFESGIFYQDTPPQEIHIPLNNAKVIRLVVTDAGNGSADGNLIWGDHADWADARLIK